MCLRLVTFSHFMHALATDQQVDWLYQLWWGSPLILNATFELQNDVVYWWFSFVPRDEQFLLKT